MQHHKKIKQMQLEMPKGKEIDLALDESTLERI